MLSFRVGPRSTDNEIQKWLAHIISSRIKDWHHVAEVYCCKIDSINYLVEVHDNFYPSRIIYIEPNGAILFYFFVRKIKNHFILVHRPLYNNIYIVLVQ